MRAVEVVESRYETGGWDTLVSHRHGKCVTTVGLGVERLCMHMIVHRGRWDFDIVNGGGD